MRGYKHIETSIARYIAGRYSSAVEVGTGNNMHAANLLFRSGILRCCTDINIPRDVIIPYHYDNVNCPNLSLYTGVECIYSIRPVEEMIPFLILLGKRVNADLCIYHLGFEGTDNPVPVSGCDVPIHRYVKSETK